MIARSSTVYQREGREAAIFRGLRERDCPYTEPFARANWLAGYRAGKRDMATFIDSMRGKR